jgi:CubicO group peptidase (beta-lactamase class C family)
MSPCGNPLRGAMLSAIALAALAALAGCDDADAADARIPARADTGATAVAATPVVATPAVATPAVATRSPAPTMGLDSGHVAEAVAAAAALPRLHNLIIARHGRVEVERHFRGPGLDEPANVKSVSKSVLSALVGIAIADGHLAGVDQRVAPFFEAYLVGDDDPRKWQITVGHLLSMQSGLAGTSGERYGAWVGSPDWVRSAITRPMVSDPGGQRVYSTGNSHLLSAVLTGATGASTWRYARERLADPLGVRLPQWTADPQGIYFGGNEMRLSPRALLRFGELYRNGGRHDGVQVVAEEWVAASLVPRAASRWSGDGYGYGWFLSRVRGHAMFYAMGYGGQFIFVVPDLELTAVVTSDPSAARDRGHNRAVRRVLAEWIVPAAELGD